MKPGRSKQTYHCEPLARLTRQLLFAPPEQRIEQVRRCEQLHDELSPDHAYPLDFLTFRITRYRRRGEPSEQLVGEAVLPDLRLMIDELSRSVDLPVTDDEPVELTPQLAARLNVSTKTIGRWRKAGLRWRWVVPGEGERKQIGFTPDAVDAFMRQYPDKVSYAAQFTTLTNEQRDQLLRRARRITSRSDASLNRVAAHLSRRTGRAIETLRQLLEKHEREHPDNPIFPDHTGPLTTRQRRVIARAIRFGVGVDRLTQRFRRSKSTIYRVVNERRAAEVRTMPITFVDSPVFHRDDADQVLLRSDERITGEIDSTRLSAVPVGDLPEALQPLYRQPAIDSPQQSSLFARYNYLKFKAQRMRDSLDRHDPSAAELDTIEQLLGRAREVRERLFRANLPVVLSVARRDLLDKHDAPRHELLRRLEVGNEVLVEAIDTFPWARDQAFDSFLTNRLMRRFAAGPEKPRARQRSAGDKHIQRIVDKAGESGVDL